MTSFINRTSTRSRTRLIRPRYARQRVRDLITVCLALLGLQTIVLGGDWPNWRGPEQNGVSRESKLPGEWNVLWEKPFGGRSTPVVLGNRVFIVNRAESGVNEQERVVCFNGDTGDVLWEHRFSVFLTDIASARIGWASPVADPETGYVYAHGVENTLLCLDDKGQVVWQRHMHEEYGTINGYGGRTHTPIIDEARVIISFLNSSWGPQAPGRHRYFAFDKRTGAVVWAAQPGGRPLDTTYSCPVIAVVNGVRLLIGGNADGSVYAMKARTGEKVWGFQLSKRGINASVVVGNNKVYVTHSEENVDEPTMGSVVCIDATGSGDVTQTKRLWRFEGLLGGYSSPVLDGNKLYVADNSANLYCIDADKGTLIWKENIGTVMKGSPVVGDGKIYVPEVNARFYLLNEKEIEERERVRREGSTAERGTLRPIEPVKLFEDSGGGITENFGSVAIAGGRVYFTTRSSIYCLGEKKWNGESGAVEPLAAESPAGSEVAHVQISPADVVLHPGQRGDFKAQSFDAGGRAIGAVSPQWKLLGIPGNVTADGRVTVDSKAGFAHGMLVASVDGVEQKARIRIVPTLPLTYDFSGVAEGKPPIGWVGAGIKFVGATYEGEKVLTKPGKRSQFMDAETFFGVPQWNNYTVQADVLAIKTRRQLPNIGLVNSRYEFVLMGNHQRLRVVSWVPQPRLEKRIKFAWDPKIWYTMKIRVDEKDGKSLVRAKAWPRAEQEPGEWDIEVKDPTPNGGGSPGLHGYSAGARAKSAGAQIYYDNVKVTPN